MAAELHRALLGMGIERPFTGKGNGRRLMEAAIAWARDTRRLSWIDLGVFANNVPARKLYARMGFVEIGMRRDAFRVDDGVSVDDISMTLELR
jgi:RimJ/RimL family protein N-acetyltransferase